MSCNTSLPLSTVVDEINQYLDNNYVDKDDPRIDQGVFTEPTIRGGLMLDEAAKLDFCNYVAECGQQPPFGKQWIARPLYPDNMLVSYDEGGEIKTKWQDTNDTVATTDIGVSYMSFEETRRLGLAGFITINSFELGATITGRNQALRHMEDGKVYRWAGDLPKVVPPSSTPSSSGGIAGNAWLEVSDQILSDELVKTVPLRGAMGAVARNQAAKNAEHVSAKDFGAIGDGLGATVVHWYTAGSSHYRNYANLEAVQVDYPHVTASTNTIDWAAIQAATNTTRQVDLGNLSYKLSAIVDVKGSICGDDAKLDITLFNNGNFYSGALLVKNQKGTKPIIIEGLNIVGNYIASYTIDLPKTLPEPDFKGNSVTDEHGHGVDIQNSDNVTVRNCRIDSVRGDTVCIGGVPYNVTDNGLCKNVKIMNNVLTNPRRCTIAVMSADYVTIDNNYLEHNHYVACIDLEPNRGNPWERANNVTISNNIYSAPFLFIQVYDGLSTRATENLTVHNNRGQCEFFIRNQAPAIARNFKITSNTMSDYTDPKHPAKSCRGIIIDDNYQGAYVLKDNTDYGTSGAGWRVKLNDTAKLVATGNTILRGVGATSGMSIEGGTCILTGNTIDASAGNAIILNNTIALISNNYIAGSHGIAVMTAGIKKSIIAGNIFNCVTAGFRGFDNTVSDVRFGENNQMISGNLVHSNSALKVMYDGAAFGGVGISQYHTDDIEKIRNLNKVEYAGSIAWHTDPLTAGFVGWVCTKSDVKGVWQKFGYFSNSKLMVGTTVQRPVGIGAGSTYFDTDLNKPIFATNTGTWVDATGAVV